MTWPIHYPDRPEIPYDPTPKDRENNRKRRICQKAEAGEIRIIGKRIPHYGVVNDAQNTQ